MTQLVQQVLDRRKELDEKTSAIRRKLQTYPDGKLICTRNGRYIKWYHSDGRIQTYIPKKKREYAEQLAEKKYWTLREHVTAVSWLWCRANGLMRCR